MKRSLSWSTLTRFIKKEVLTQGASSSSISSCPLQQNLSPGGGVRPSLEAIPDGFIAPQLAKELLNLPYRQKLLANIWQRTSVSKKLFEQLYLKPIHLYAEYVQLFPASESHHHAYPGGMLDHGLEIVAYALKLRQSHLLPIGSSPETQAVQSDAWSAACAYAALLHDIGKIAVDLHVEYEDGKLWHPWHGVLKAPYRFKYKQDRSYQLHGAAAGLLYNRILTSEILDWLSTYTELWQMLIHFLSGQAEHAGVLGELVIKADQASVAQELGGDPQKIIAAPKNALQKKLLDGLRYLVKETLKINQAGAGDGWLTDDALWLVSKTVMDKLRAHLLSQGISGIPEKNSVLLDVLEEHHIIEAKPEGGAIWTAQVTSSTGWSQQLTLIKTVPAIIWSDGIRPASFTGSIEVKNKDDEVPEQVLKQPPEQENHDSYIDERYEKQTYAHEPSYSNLNTEAGIKNDALSAVLDLLEMKEDVFTPQNDYANQDEQEHKLSSVSSIKNASASVSLSPKSLQSLSSAEKHEKIISGELFMVWFREALISKKLIMNDSSAVVHTVMDTFYLVTPGIFMRYVQEFPEIEAIAKKEALPGWHWAQKRFEKLGVHKKQNNGHNIWTCKAAGPRKSGAKLHGYLLLKPEGMLPILHNNPYLEPVVNIEMC